MVGVEQTHAHSGGHLEEGSDGAGRVALFDALQQAARDTGAVSLRSIRASLINWLKTSRASRL
ncbi:hypothetical protein [Rhizobium redzepovicii]|uniref:hypothetical protein n=1 Tax=Rhizobium redzepovicii TaxID=2867518 RepID=UPI001C92E686|nr:hypothetical protein [Rhizobium redzepovicii]